jgi:predicted RNase H-like nuclease (RuvC/YqgF family)
MSETPDELDLEIVGKKTAGKSVMEIEDFWMARLQSIENQYDQHVVQLERKLLDQKRNSRIVTSLQQHNARLQDQVTQGSTQAMALTRKLETLQSDLKDTQKKVSDRNWNTRSVIPLSLF